MKKIGFSLLLIAAMTFAVSAFACGADKAKAAVAEKALCSACGQVKGSESCCKPDAEKCGKCGLDKGSPGCCKLPKAG